MKRFAVLVVAAAAAFAGDSRDVTSWATYRRLRGLDLPPAPVHLTAALGAGAATPVGLPAVRRLAESTRFRPDTVAATNPRAFAIRHY